ncbi:MAG: hypothetical protein HY998_08310 [candidate division NC10 bacterium]|nr:hypothetical protein [candidate division NC10 bacterium]
MGEELKLKDGSSVAVIGGGPAGSFFSIHALNLARSRGWKLKLTIFDRKFFEDCGPLGCNMCAGAIGSGLVGRLQQLNLPLPPNVVRHEIKGYVFHAFENFAALHGGPEEKIYTVFRGAGPLRRDADQDKVSFDQHLLNVAASMGAEVLHEGVNEVVLPSQKGERALIKYGGGRGIYETDLLVGAFGVNTRMTERLPFGYRPPETWHTCQAEIEVGRAFNREVLQDMIHIFSPLGSGLIFSALTPKGDYLTVTGIGEHVKIKDLLREMDSSEMGRFLPREWSILCHCHPRVPVTSAERPFTDRLVIIGDANCSRFLKSGIESAYFTAFFAADTAFRKGISKEDFALHYHSRCRSMFGRDNWYGKLMFTLHRLASSNRVLSRSYLEVVKREQSRPNDASRILSHVLWYMFTGDAPYKKIFFQILRPRLLWRLGQTTAENLSPLSSRAGDRPL